MNRKRLPNRRGSELTEIEFRNCKYTIAFSRYQDEDNPAEVFIHSHKLASHMDSDGRDIAVLLSIAIQYGVPLSVMAEAVGRDESGDPMGLAGMVIDFLRAQAAGQLPMDAVTNGHAVEH